MIFLSLRPNFLKSTTVNVNARKTDDDNTGIVYVFEMWIVMNAGAVLHPLRYQANCEQVNWVLLPGGLITQLVEPCTCIAQVRVQITVRAFLAAAIAALKCDDLIHSLEKLFIYSKT